MPTSLHDRAATGTATGAAGPSPGRPSAGIDPRGPQFTATITAVVLVAILLTSYPIALTLTVIQVGLFAVGAVAGVQKTPQAFLFRYLVRPRLRPPAELEDPAPPRFAQAVGLVFTAVALVAFAVGATPVAQVAIGLALVAAVLNAVFRFCLGCELYLLIRRVTH